MRYDDDDDDDDGGGGGGLSHYALLRKDMPSISLPSMREYII